MKRAEKHEHLVDVATKMFNRLGYHAVGIDQIIAETGIAKTTMYRHFESKDALIVAVLKRLDVTIRDAMRNAVDARARNSKQKLLATFDFLEECFKDYAFYGCPFMSAASEYNDRTNPVFQEVLLHKRLMIAYFEELTRGAELDDPARVAEEINLLHEGAIAVAQINGAPTTARKAKAMATRLIDDASADLKDCA